MNIRSANFSDISAIERVVATAYSKYIPHFIKPPGPMRDDYAAYVRNYAAWVIGDEPRVFGLIVLIPMPDHLLVDNVAVDSVLQGRGIGRTLLAFADAEAVRRGFADLRLYTHETMTKNIMLYRTLGWQETGRREQNGYRCVFFRKAPGSGQREAVAKAYIDTIRRLAFLGLPPRIIRTFGDHAAWASATIAAR